MLNENLDLFTGGLFSSPGTINGVEVEGIFDEYYEQGFDMAESLPTEGRKYCYRVNSKEVVGLNHHALATVNGRQFEVIGIQPVRPDGMLTDLVLQELS